MSSQGASEPAAASISSIDDVDEEVDDSGVEESDVKLVMDQAQVSCSFISCKVSYNLDVVHPHPVKKYSPEHVQVDL